MKNTELKVARWVVVALATVLLGVAGTAKAEMVTFEATTPATYVAGNSFDGVDGWISNATSVVTPDSGGYAETRVLSGSQSGAVFYGSTKRVFDTGTALGDGSVLSWRTLVDGTGGYGLFCLSHNIESGETPGGIFANVGGNFTLFGLNVNPGATVGVSTDNDYLLEMVLDFTNDQFEGFCTDITGGGSRTSLGTADFYEDLDASSTATNGGFALFGSATGGGAVTIYDDISVSVIPEPSSLALLISGLAIVLLGCCRWWKRKRA